MNKTLSIFVVAGLMLACASFAAAQGPGPAGGKVGEKAGPRPGVNRLEEIEKRVLQKLDLSKDQWEKVRDLDKKTKADATELRKEMQEALKAGKDMSAFRGKMRDIMKAHHQGLMAILTPDQQRKFKVEMRRVREEMKEKWGKDKDQGKGLSKGG
ncbi:MAG: hypothetical protein HY248_06495 [Fimbriimonas ginsengisoli]|nr:hypothetical protein [Fimbriimonas ginsengisoli]